MTLVAEWIDQFGADSTVTAFSVWARRMCIAPGSSQPARLYQLNADGTMTLLGTTSSAGLADGRAVIDNLPGVLLTQAGLWDMTGSVGVGTQTLAALVGEIAQRAGLVAGDIDATALLATQVRGYARTRPMSAREALQPLQSFHWFDVVESAGKVKFVKRGGAPVAALTADDLGADAPGEPVQVIRAQEIELPQEIALGFADADHDHEPGIVRARRLVTASHQQSALEFPLLASSAEAAGAADVLMRDAWRGRNRYQFALPPRFAALDPADVITLPVAGQAHQVRLTRTAAMPAGPIRCEAVSESQSAYTSSAAGTDAGLWQAQTIALAGPTNGVLLDLPALRDVDGAPGLYLAASGYLTGWRGGVLYKSSDGGATWAQAEAVTAPAAIGAATTVLASGRTDIFDEANTLTVRLASAGTSLASASELSVLNGANACALGMHGRWEVLQFKTATQNGDGTWTLSGLLRGRKGTEHAIGSHVVGDTFVLLASASVLRLPLNAAEIGAARHWRFASFGQAMEDTAIVALTPAAVALEPYAPVQLGGGRNAAGDLTINWIRRNRIDHEWRDLVEVPNSEASESYEIEIWTGGFGTLKRTLTTATPTVAYTSAQQVTDFGGNQASVSTRVYQLSAVTGRGYVLQGVI